MSIVFQWDDKKARSNFKKHGIRFEEAKSAFYDEYARIIDDPDHSDGEDRYVLLGVSLQSNVLVVWHCYREPDETIRIISARKATRKEANTYRKLT